MRIIPYYPFGCQRQKLNFFSTLSPALQVAQRERFEHFRLADGWSMPRHREVASKMCASRSHVEGARETVASREASPSQTTFRAGRMAASVVKNPQSWKTVLESEIAKARRVGDNAPCPCRSGCVAGRCKGRAWGAAFQHTLSHRANHALASAKARCRDDLGTVSERTKHALADVQTRERTRGGLVAT